MDPQINWVNIPLPLKATIETLLETSQSTAATLDELKQTNDIKLRGLTFDLHKLQSAVQDLSGDMAKVKEAQSVNYASDIHALNRKLKRFREDQVVGIKDLSEQLYSANTQTAATVESLRLATEEGARRQDKHFSEIIAKQSATFQIRLDRSEQ